MPSQTPPQGLRSLQSRLTVAQHKFQQPAKGLTSRRFRLQRSFSIAWVPRQGCRIIAGARRTGRWVAEDSVRRAIISAVMYLIALGPAFAEVRIFASPGGDVEQYLMFFALLQETGERIVIDGPCFSACTLALSTIPREQMCVTPRAVMGFHAPECSIRMVGSTPLLMRRA